MKGLAVLFAIALLALILILLANPLAAWSGSWGSDGTLTFNYASGSEAVQSVTFQLPSDFAGRYAIDSTDSGWTAQALGDQVHVAGGSLAPGGTLQVHYHAIRYLTPRQVSIVSTATTASGSTFTASGPLVVQENFLLLVFTEFGTFPPTLAAFGVGVVASANFVDRLTQPSKGEVRLEEECGHSVVVYSCFLYYSNPRDCTVTHRVSKYGFPWSDEHTWCFDCTWDRNKLAIVGTVCYCLKGWFGWGGASNCDRKSADTSKKETVRKQLCLPKEGHTDGDEKTPPAPPGNYDVDQKPADCKKEPGYPETPGLNCVDCPDT